MPEPRHFLEMVADDLGERLKAEVDAKAEAVTGPNGRPLFTQKMTKSQALVWWQQHRYDALGKQVLDGMAPADVLALDQALSQAAQVWLGGEE